MDELSSELRTANLEWLRRELLRCPLDDSPIDHRKYFKHYELAAAIEYGLVMWEKLPPKTFDDLGIVVRRLKADSTPRDYGIDCASIDLKRAAQVKFHSPRNQISWRAISTFHTMSTVCKSSELQVISPPSVSIMSLAETLPIEQKHLSEERFREICHSALSDREFSADLDSFVDSLLDELEVPSPPLRKCQREAIELASESFANGAERVAVSMPCGTGKSRVICELIRASTLDVQHLVFVPSKLLMYQMRSAFTEWAPELSVGLVGDSHKLSETPEADVYVVIYNSVEQVEDGEWGMVVVDEAHHVFSEFASEYAYEEDREFAEAIRMLHQQQTLLVSATLPDEDDIPLSYGYTIEEAINDGILVDYHILIPVVSSGSPREALVTLLGSHLEWGRVLAYCNSLKAAEEFCGMLCDAGISAVWFGGKTPVAERNARIADLCSGMLRVLVTVHTLGEGIDIPEADCCVFVEPRGSPIDVTQCVGRVLRTAPGKTSATVVLPSSDEERDLVRFLSLLQESDSRVRCSERGHNRINVVEISGTGNLEESELLCESVYDRTGALISGGEWQVKLEHLREYVAENDKLPPQGTTYRGVKLGVWVNRQRQDKKKGTISIERVGKLEAVHGWHWGNEDLFVARLNLVREYTKEYGKLPPSGATYQSVKIGMWCQNQRSKKREGNITMERAKLLENIPGWCWEPNMDRFGERLDLLMEYINIHGKLPPQSANYRGIRIGTWCHKQRAKKKMGVLPQERIDQLGEVPGWLWEAEDSFPARLELLRDYVVEYNEQPPRNITYRGVKLGSWCKEQRRNKRDGKLSAERSSQLEAVPGWLWEVEDPFPARLELLRNYVDEYDKLPPQRATYRGTKLGFWCSRQRSEKKMGNVSDERCAQLETIPGWFWSIEDLFNKHIALLHEYVADHGNLPPQKLTYRNFKLGSWCNRQRQDKKKGKMSKERIAALEVVPGWRW